MARIVIAGMLLVAAVTAGAGEEDHDRARAALDRGEVMPLRTILDRLEREHPGRVVEVELEREDGRWIYEIRMLREGGELEKLEVDARDGAVLSVKTRGDRKGRH